MRYIVALFGLMMVSFWLYSQEIKNQETVGEALLAGYKKSDYFTSFLPDKFEKIFYANYQGENDSIQTVNFTLSYLDSAIKYSPSRKGKYLFDKLYIYGKINDTTMIEKTYWQLFSAPGSDTIDLAMFYRDMGYLKESFPEQDSARFYYNKAIEMYRLTPDFYRKDAKSEIRSLQKRIKTGSNK